MSHAPVGAAGATVLGVLAPFVAPPEGVIFLLHLIALVRAQPSPICNEHASTNSTTMIPVSTAAPPLSHASTCGGCGGGPRRSQGGGAQDADRQRQAMSCKKQWVVANDKRWANQLGVLRPRSPQMMVKELGKIAFLHVLSRRSRISRTVSDPTRLINHA